MLVGDDYGREKSGIGTDGMQAPLHLNPGKSRIDQQ
jgi:hypothetical protein